MKYRQPAIDIVSKDRWDAISCIPLRNINFPKLCPPEFLQRQCDDSFIHVKHRTRQSRTIAAIRVNFPTTIVEQVKKWRWESAHTTTQAWISDSQYLQMNAYTYLVLTWRGARDVIRQSPVSNWVFLLRFAKAYCYMGSAQDTEISTISTVSMRSLTKLVTTPTKPIDSVAPKTQQLRFHRAYTLRAAKTIDIGHRKYRIP